MRILKRVPVPFSFFQDIHERVGSMSSTPGVPPRKRAEQIRTAVELHRQAVQLRGEGKLADALDRANQALQILEEACGPDHPDVANVFLCRGDVHQDAARYDQAERDYERAVAIMNQVSGSEPIDRRRVQSLGRLAGIHRVRGRHESAERLFQRAVGYAVRSLGPMDLDLAKLLNDTALPRKVTSSIAAMEML